MNLYPGGVYGQKCNGIFGQKCFCAFEATGRSPRAVLEAMQDHRDYLQRQELERAAVDAVITKRA